MTDSSRDADEYRWKSERITSVFSALADEDRLRTTRYCETADTDSIAVDSLVEAIHRGERTRTECEIALRHTVLPKLADEGVIEYDTRGKRIRYRGHPLLEQVLSALTEPVAGTAD